MSWLAVTFTTQEIRPATSLLNAVSKEKMMKEEKGRERHRLENIAKDRKVIPDPIDDRKFQE